jgi:3-methyladenine DNA glycosylase AlkC
MPEPFKNFFNTQIILGMATSFQGQWSEFESEKFFDAASKNLDALELKQRSEQIMDEMIAHLPNNFVKAGEIILGSLSPPRDGDIFGVTVGEDGIAGWAIMPMAHYVGLRGHDHFDLSMTLFKELTKRFTSEFGIRFFLLESPEKTLSTLKEWTNDSDRHVRRLVSEGTRPRLPWAMQLPLFIQNPSPVIELLDMLKDDEEEYVRRSVANNLNDIAKDHPEIVADIAEKWMRGASKNREKLIRHGCRTLIKNGHKKVLRVFGYKPPQIQQAAINIKTPEVVFGGALEFSLSILSDALHAQPLMIDYILHHKKANGKTTPKVFKWRTKTLEANKLLTLTKKHAIKKITTRVYYPGFHRLEVMVNGVSVGMAEFNLLIP